MKITHHSLFLFHLFQSVNAMDMPKAATLTGHPGEILASVVEVCVTVCTTPRAVNVRSARLASTEIPNDLTLLLTPANVRHSLTPHGMKA